MRSHYRKETHHLRYKVSGRDGPVDKEVVEIDVWLALKDNLPVKTVLSRQTGWRVEEAYLEWEFDPTVDANLFELPIDKLRKK
jgi:hypothetical protein